MIGSSGHEPSQAAGESDLPPLAAHALLAAVLGLGAILRVWLALHDDGLYWCDEIHQTLEVASDGKLGLYRIRTDGCRPGARPVEVPQ